MVCAAALAVWSVAPRAADAQRGEAFVEQSAPRERPHAGFPGLLNSHTVERGDIVADLPFLSIDYGVTENLSVGTNLLMALPMLGGQPSLLGTARYRMYASDRVTSVLDGSVGYLSYSDTVEEDGEQMDESLQMWVTMFGSNTSIHLGDRQSVTLSGLALRLSGSAQSSEDPPGFESHQSVTALLFATTYELALTRRLAMEATALSIPLVSGSLDSSVGAQSIELGADDNLGDRTLGRLLLSARLGNWLLSGGAMVNLTASARLPWLSVAKKW